MLIAITGTPGVGKTTVSGALREKGYDVIDLSEHIRINGLIGDYDGSRDTYGVDTDELNKMTVPEGLVFAEGHLSHFLKCGIVIVLRCRPSVLYERLSERGYAESKIIENVQAEALDVILCESLALCADVYEIDCTSSNIDTIITAIDDILSGNTGKYIPGSADWTEEMDKWF